MLCPLLPTAPGEIRKRHGGASICYGLLTQRAWRAERGRVVHVHVGRGALDDALYKTVRHDEIHPAVAAQLPRQLAGLFPPRELQLRVQRAAGPQYVRAAMLGYFTHIA